MTSEKNHGEGHGLWRYPKLEGDENYRPWARSTKAAMKYEGFWEIVCGIELKPVLWRERKDAEGNITQAPTPKEKAEHEIKLVD